MGQVDVKIKEISLEQNNDLIQLPTELGKYWLT